MSACGCKRHFHDSKCMRTDPSYGGIICGLFNGELDSSACRFAALEAQLAEAKKRVGLLKDSSNISRSIFRKINVLLGRPEEPIYALQIPEAVQTKVTEVGALEAALEELWGACCPDCGPNDYSNIVRLVGDNINMLRAKVAALEAERAKERALRENCAVDACEALGKQQAVIEAAGGMMRPMCSYCFLRFDTYAETIEHELNKCIVATTRRTCGHPLRLPVFHDIDEMDAVVATVGGHRLTKADCLAINRALAIAEGAADDRRAV